MKEASTFRDVPNAIHLQDGSLVLRSAEPRDAQQLTDWWNDGAVMAHAGFPLGLGQTVEQTVAQITRLDVEQGYRLIIQVGGVPIGEMSVGFPLSTSAEIGIKICVPTQQNRGLGPQALTLLIDHLVTVEHVTRVILDTNLNNLRAQKVYERLGFRRLQTRIDAFRDQLDRPQSLVDYELVATEWSHHHH